MAYLGHVYAWSGRIEEGVSWPQQSLTAHESTGLGYFQSLSVAQLGEVYLLATEQVAQYYGDDAAAVRLSVAGQAKK